MSIDTTVELSDDRTRATITIRSVRGTYHADIAGERNIWMIRKKDLPGGFGVKYVNNTDGTLSDIHVEQTTRYRR